MRKLVFGLGLVLAACGSDQIDAIRFEGPDLDAGTDGEPGDAALPQVACDATRIERCQVGRCVVSAPRSTLQEGEVVEIVEQPSSTLGDDPLPGSSLCRVTLPARFATEGVAVTLEIQLEGAAPADAVLFRSENDEGIRVAASAASGNGASGLVSATGLFGVTRQPGPLVAAGSLVGDPQRSDTAAALIRNVSSGRGMGATWDGTHTFVASGRRVLVYSGMPGPADRPELVLGAPTLDTVSGGVTASSFAGVNDVWTDGQKLAVSDGNRVLLYRQIPTTPFAPADVVLGQRDFITTTANAGGCSASTVDFVGGLDSDGTRLVVADVNNNRVLSWDHWPTQNGEPATGLVGGPDFTARPRDLIYQARGVALDGQALWTAATFTSPLRIASATAFNPPALFNLLDYSNRVAPTTASSGFAVTRLSGTGLALADSVSQRVAIWRDTPSTAKPIDFALGQLTTDRTTRQPTSSSSFTLDAAGDGPAYLRVAGPYLFVGDVTRDLVYDHKPRYFYEPADRVLRQPGFTTDDVALDTRFVSEQALGYPAGVAASSTHLAIADRGNNRVLLFPSTALGNDDPKASVILGQPDANSVIPNVDQVSPSASTLSGPTTALFVGPRLVVADTENHRVLVWNTIPQTTGAPADLVLGQADMAGRKPNRNRGDEDLDGHSDASLDGMFYPTGLASDGTRLFVSDRAQNRILVWDTFPTTSGQAADRVLGQSTASAVLPNRGQGSQAVVEDGLLLPTALLLDGDSLYVADTENNRVLRWDDVDGTPTPGLVFGQPDGVTVQSSNVYSVAASNAGAPAVAVATAATVLRPAGLALAQGHLFVSERDGNRVHVFDRTTAAHVAVLGHSAEDRSDPNEGGVSARSLLAPAGLATTSDTLWVADGGNHRVVGFPLSATTTSFAEATHRIGQASWVQSGYSRSLPVSAGGAPGPSGLAATPQSLFVVESNYNRVLAYDRTDLGAGILQRIYGQPDATSIRRNAGGVVTAGTLSGPRGVFVTDALLFVADTENSRVLVFDRQNPGREAMRVLGQADMGHGQSNRGGAPSLATLSRPEAVSFDGTRVFVSDTGNHRVLVWNALPTADGATADAVLGQNDVASGLGNQGASNPSAGSLSSPVGLLADASGLFVADTQNNRIVHFAAPFTNGQSADQILGQASATERTPAGGADDLQHSNGPVSLASDGATLYVGERDGRRLLLFRPRDGVTATAAIPGSQAPGAGFTTPLGLALERTPLFTSRLLVADGSAQRVSVFESASRLRDP